jgi:hypothetical protein
MASWRLWFLVSLSSVVVSSASCSKSNTVNQNNNNSSTSITEVVDAEGAKLLLPSGASVDIPPNALGTSVSLTASEDTEDPQMPPLDVAQYEKLSPIVVVEPHGQTFNQEVIITLPHQGSDPSQVAVLRADPNGDWAPVPVTAQTGAYVQVRTNIFSYYVAVAGEPIPDTRPDGGSMDDSGSGATGATGAGGTTGGTTGGGGTGTGGTGTGGTPEVMEPPCEQLDIEPNDGVVDVPPVGPAGECMPGPMMAESTLPDETDIDTLYLGASPCQLFKVRDDPNVTICYYFDCGVDNVAGDPICGDGIVSNKYLDGIDGQGEWVGCCDSSLEVDISDACTSFANEVSVVAETVGNPGQAECVPIHVNADGMPF